MWSLKVALSNFPWPWLKKPWICTTRRRLHTNHSTVVLEKIFNPAALNIFPCKTESPNRGQNHPRDIDFKKLQSALPKDACILIWLILALLLRISSKNFPCILCKALIPYWDLHFPHTPGGHYLNTLESAHPEDACIANDMTIYHVSATLEIFYFQVFPCIFLRKTLIL